MLARWLSPATLLLTGALSFSVQPLVARMLLPYLGGAPTVWVVSLLFFQTALLAGYAYAHGLARVRGLRVQLGIHLVVLAGAAFALPPALRTITLWDPSATTLVTLAATVGAPYVAVVATSPLVQHWLARSRIAADPYVLYAASNGGSLLGLLAYPFVVEPLFGLTAQRLGWAFAYGVAALLIAACGVLAISRAVEHAEAREVGPAIPLRGYARWLGLAALPTAWLGAVTTHVTSAIAPIPLLWVVPLAIYLVTLIVAFAPRDVRTWLDAIVDRAISASGITDARRARALAVPGTVALAALALAMHVAEPVPVIVAIHMTALLAGALVCHTKLADRRPPASRLTAYYLAVAAGGALGGAFAGVVAPAVFDSLLEYPIVLAAFIASGLAFSGRGRWGRVMPAAAVAVALTVAAAAGLLHWFLVPIALAVAALASFAAARSPRVAGALLLAALVAADASPIVGGYRQIRTDRSFFGVNRVLVSPDGSQHVLLNGPVVHGAQFVDDGTAPMSYYTREGPLGDVLGPTTRMERVGAIGLGAGAVACYASATRSVTFYEIDPTVVALASDPSLFTYVSRCRPAAIIIGDARISLQDTPDAAYEVLVVDAYSGDAMPIHLLTREAFALYRRVLAPGGVIALHLSNAYFDLEPLVAALAQEDGLASRIRDDTDAEAAASAGYPAAWSPSVWALLGADADVRGRVGDKASWTALRMRADLRAWTDDFADPLAIRR